MSLSLTTKCDLIPLLLTAHLAIGRGWCVAYLGVGWSVGRLRQNKTWQRDAKQGIIACDSHPRDRRCQSPITFYASRFTHHFFPLAFFNPFTTPRIHSTLFRVFSSVPLHSIDTTPSQPSRAK